MPMTRSLLTRSLFLLAMISLAACGGTPAATPVPESSCAQPSPKVEVASKELNIFVWPEYVPQEVMDCFEEVYGLQLNHDEFSSPEEMYAKLSQGVSGYDVVQPTDYIVQLMASQGMLAQLDHNKLSVLGNFAPQYLNPQFDPDNKYTLPYQVGSSGITYNADSVKTPPTSYADLWKAEYAGHLVMLDDARNVIGLTLLSLGYDPNSADPAQLDEAKAKLVELVPNVRIFDSDSPKSALIAGDADLGVMWSGETSVAQAEVSSIQYVYPTEGVILFQDNFAVMAAAPHADAAYAWLNYLYQPDVFWMVMRDFPYANPNAAAIDWAKTNQPDVYNAYISSNITNMPAEAMSNGHWLTDLGEAAPLYDKIWTEAKGR